jgi:hypothetical protein
MKLGISSEDLQDFILTRQKHEQHQGAGRANPKLGVKLPRGQIWVR